MSGQETHVNERQCAICGRKQQARPSMGGIAAFTLPLKWLGIAGNYAHPACLRQAQTKSRGFQVTVQTKPPRFTVYAVERDGNPWDVLLTDDPSEARKALNQGRAEHPRYRHYGVFETDEPERGDAETLIDELIYEAEQEAGK